jgi:hypothetical protein
MLNSGYVYASTLFSSFGRLEPLLVEYPEIRVSCDHPSRVIFSKVHGDALLDPERTAGRPGSDAVRCDHDFRIEESGSSESSG